MKKFNNILLIKKSQISIFILIGFVIIGGFLFFYMNNMRTLNQLKTEQIIEIPQEIKPINIFIESCIRNTATDGIFFNGLQGGYYQNYQLAEPYSFLAIPYHYHLGNNYFPSLQTIEAELSRYIEINLKYCINDFTDFKKLGYGFEIGKVAVETNFANDNTLINVNYPINVDKQEVKHSLTEFLIKIDFDFSKIYDYLIKINNEQQKNPDFIPMGYLSDLASKNDFIFETMQLEDNIIFYTLIFNTPEKFKDPYLFNYASKYKWTELSTDSDKQKVIIEDIDNQEAYVGYKFSYQVKAKGNNLKFLDYSPLFDIDENNGLIEFEVSNNNGGKHYPMIKVEDDQGNFDKKIFELDITGFNRNPKLEKIPNLNAQVGQPFAYQVKASDPDNDLVFFLDDTEMFIINTNNGIIGFTPAIENKGEHLITISAVDQYGLADQEKFTLVIE
jgi:hypothetical protein